MHITMQCSRSSYISVCFASWLLGRSIRRANHPSRLYVNVKNFVSRGYQCC